MRKEIKIIKDKIKFEKEMIIMVRSMSGHARWQDIEEEVQLSFNKIARLEQQLKDLKVKKVSK